MANSLTNPATSKTDPKKLDAFVAQISDVATLPQVALRVMRVAGDAEAGAGELAAAVESDPSLTARVLRCVNSAAYSLARRVETLREAIAFLGSNQVRNLAMTASIREVFSTEGQLGTYSRIDLWHHMVACGIGAQMVAEETNCASPEDAFLGGLLHDLGIALLDQHAGPLFHEVIQRLDTSKTLIEVETSVLGFDHTTLGAQLAENWNFPEAAAIAIRYHHDASKAPRAQRGVARAVEFSNFLCSLRNITSVGMRLIPPPLNTVSHFKMGREDVVALAERLGEEIDKHDHLFKI